MPKSKSNSQAKSNPGFKHDIVDRKYEGIKEKDYLQLLYLMKLTRSAENRVVKLYRQGKVVGGVYLGTGMEATAVGSAYALDRKKDDALFPLIRDLGAHFAFGQHPKVYFLQYLNRANSPTKGKDGNIHLSDSSKNIIGMISHLSAMIPPAVGWALALKMRGSKGVTMNYIGNGGSQVGDFHEGLNFASVRKAPFVLIIENNQYAYSTPNTLQYACEKLSDRAIAYGIPGYQIDGTNVLEVFETCWRAVQRARSGEGPTLIEAVSMRMRGHSEHDDHKYVPPHLLEEWAKKDPIRRYEAFLLEKGLMDEKSMTELDQRVEKEIDDAVQFAEDSPLPEPQTAAEGVYAD
ncbi:MAG: thiamine pyrophosphate-dependent dehydrogenase E1 component subunit alpha [bacterium]|nr:thiamine pyrophosphate-dependent dehydrogenase E1 component subunit alpha [bacterium]